MLPYHDANCFGNIWLLAMPFSEWLWGWPKTIIRMHGATHAHIKYLTREEGIATTLNKNSPPFAHK